MEDFLHTGGGAGMLLQFMKNLNMFASRDDVDDTPIGTTVVGGASASEEVSDDGGDGDRDARPGNVSHSQTAHVESSSTGNSDTE